MCTGFFCPSRQTRAMACSSVAGFQSGSTTTKWLAPTRLMPAPPALAERRNTNAALPPPRLKPSTMPRRSLVGVAPSRRAVAQSRAAQREATTSKVAVLVDTTTARSPRWRTASRSASRTASLPESFPPSTQTPRVAISDSARMAARGSDSSRRAHAETYAHRCEAVMAQQTKCSVFGGRSFRSMSAAVRRRKNVETRLRSPRSAALRLSRSARDAPRRAPAVAFATTSRRKSARSPRQPGLTIVARAWNSSRLFMHGVPVRSRRFAARQCWIAATTTPDPDLRRWPSSITSKSNCASPVICSACRANDSYDTDSTAHVWRPSMAAHRAMASLSDSPLPGDSLAATKVTFELTAPNHFLSSAGHCVTSVAGQMIAALRTLVRSVSLSLTVSAARQSTRSAASVVSVLPRPISSARMQPVPSGRMPERHS
mmetsp:Transcript_19270/g.65098  ORF Transcript_19270/g.65098 Transcript_19270/m.65098 type:complete len:429 (-) Transcript_19270:553-1839(-)